MSNGYIGRIAKLATKSAVTAAADKKYRRRYLTPAVLSIGLVVIGLDLSQCSTHESR